MLKRSFVFLLLVLFSLGQADNAWAQRNLSFIRDAEIEHTVRAFATPVFQAAGLNAAAVRIHLVNDEDLNAFVAGGQQLFLFTGLLLRAETPGQLIGVIAHETGHIAGGHLARTRNALRGATALTILSMVLGVGAAIAGSTDAAGALIVGGQTAAQNVYLKYSQMQESSADQAAITFLNRSGQSGRGLVQFLDILGDQAALMGRSQDTYARTHPITSERIARLRARVEASPFVDVPDAPEFVHALAMAQAKLYGFLKRPEQTFRAYPKTDDSAPAHYARAIAYHKLANVEQALAELAPLLAAEPGNAYFWELKSQILYENGRIEPALKPAEMALRLQPDEPLLRAGLGQVMVATERPDMIAAAIPHLEGAVAVDPDMPGAWRQLAIAYGRGGRLGMSALASAEQSYRLGHLKAAIGYAQRAQQRLGQGSVAYQQAKDLEGVAQRELKRQRR